MFKISRSFSSARVAIAQLTCSTNPESNFSQIEKIVKKAAENQAKLVCLPENFNFIGRSGESLPLAQSLSGPYISKYISLARSEKIWLSLGGFQESSQTASKLHNTHIIISDQGEIKAAYRKIHLFDIQIGGKVFLESKFTESGEETIVVDSPIGKLGLSICYDLRFPELYRKLSLKGAEVLLVPATFLVDTGCAHWEILLRARAIENGCYVVASTQFGSHDCGRISYGHSCVVDPWGTIVAHASENTQIFYYDIDLEYLRECRKKIPTLDHVKLI